MGSQTKRARTWRNGRSRLLAAGVTCLAFYAASHAAAVTLPKGICNYVKNQALERESAPNRDVVALGEAFKNLDAIPKPFSESEVPAYEHSVAAVLQAIRAENIRLGAKFDTEHKFTDIYEKFGNIEQALAHITLAIAAQNDSRNNMQNNYARAKTYLMRAFLLRAVDRPDQALADVQTAQKFGCQGPVLDKFIADLSAEASAQAAAAQRRAKLLEEAQLRGTEAEQNSDFRGALGIYISALATAGPGELPSLLIAKAIDAAGKLSPPPPIPEEARKHAVFAQTAFKEAKTKDGFKEARAQYSTALLLAPWWADAWVTLSAVDEKLGDYAAAASDLETYLRAAPRAPDRDAVQNKIYELQFKAKR